MIVDGVELSPEAAAAYAADLARLQTETLADPDDEVAYGGGDVPDADAATAAAAEPLAALDKGKAPAEPSQETVPRKDGRGVGDLSDPALASSFDNEPEGSQAALIKSLMEENKVLKMQRENDRKVEAALVERTHRVSSSGPKVNKPPVFDGSKREAVPVEHFLVQLRAYVAACSTDEQKLGLAVNLVSGTALTFWLAEARTLVHPSFADFCAVLERRFMSALVWRKAQEALFDATSSKWLRQVGSVADYYGRFKQLLAELSQAPTGGLIDETTQVHRFYVGLKPDLKVKCSGADRPGGWWPDLTTLSTFAQTVEPSTVHHEVQEREWFLAGKKGRGGNGNGDRPDRRVRAKHNNGGRGNGNNGGRGGNGNGGGSGGHSNNGGGSGGHGNGGGSGGHSGGGGGSGGHQPQAREPWFYAMSKDVHQERLRKGLCIKCGQKGHGAKQCSNPPVPK